MATTYMSLTLPTIGTTTGPAGHTLINTAMETIDAHDHTTGKGTTIPTSALNINANLNFNGYNLTNVGTFSCGAATVTSLTSSGAINGTTGTFTGTLTGVAANFSGNLTATAGTFSGLVTTTAGITTGSTIVSDTNNTDTLGTSGVRWANIFSVLGNFSGTITSSTVVPSTTNTYDLGSSSAQYSNLYVATILSNNSQVLVTDHLNPTTNNTYTLGNTSTPLRWAEVNAVLGNFSGNLTTGALVAAAGNTHDIGSSGTRYDEIFASALDLSKTSATIINTASDGTSSNSILSHYSSTASAGANLILRRSKNATLGSHTAVALNDELGRIAFQGSDGVEFLNAAAIACTVPAAVTGGGTDDMPGQLIFYTTPDGSGTLTPAMYILSNQSTAFAGTIRGTGPGTIDCGDASFLWDNGYFNNASFAENLAGPERIGQRSYRNNNFAWAVVVANGASNPTVTAANSYNLSTFTWSATGVYVVTLSTAMTQVSAASAHASGTTALHFTVSRDSTTQYTLRSFDAAGAAADVANPNQIHFICMGY